MKKQHEILQRTMYEMDSTFRKRIASVASKFRI